MVHRFFLVGGLFAGLIGFQNCSDANLDSPNENSLSSIKRIENDLVVISSPADSVFYVGTQVRVAVLVRSELNLPMTYRWLKNGAPIPGQTSQTLAFGPAAVGDAGVYEVVVDNEVDTVSVKLNISISSAPVILISAQPQPINVTAGQTATLQVVAQSSDPNVPLKYQWLKNGVALAGKTTAQLSVANAAVADSGRYLVNVSNTVGVEQITASNSVAVSVAFESAVTGCAAFTVPTGTVSLRVTAIGGGGGGNRSSASVAYNTLSGGGGAAVQATVPVALTGASVPYCVGAAGGVNGSGGVTSLATLILANGGSVGNGWHYKNEDGRGTPPTLGGTFALGTGVIPIRAANGANVTSFGACGGNAGFGLDTVNTGAGGCSAAQSGLNFGGGGWGNGAYYTNGSATAGASGYIRIEPVL